MLLLHGTIYMGRKAREGIVRRIQLRIEEGSIEIFDRYTDAERNEIFNCALKTIYPKIPDSPEKITLIRPPKPITETICRIIVQKRTVQLIFPEKRDDFRNLVKGFCYTWQGCWERTFKAKIDILDRAAEIGHELLLAKFCIQVDIDSVKDRIVGMKFLPEAFKAIDAGNNGVYTGWLTFFYPKDEDWYPEIMKITAAKYVDGRIYVPPEHYLEVEDFAEINDFQFTESAVEVIEKAKAIKAEAIEIVPRRRQVKNQKTKQHESQNNSIPQHLRDD